VYGQALASEGSTLIVENPYGSTRR
jgi:hypothetical protein